MGQLFGQQGLTQPGTALNYPGGQTDVGTPDQVKKGFLRAAIADEQNQHPYLPGTPNPNPAPQSPSIGQPSFQQAATAGATPGGGNALSPGLTKAGKLATLLTSGLQGALAGRAKSEETVAATGGRRSGGAGMGFEAGFTLPWQRQAQLNQLAQQQAQTGVLQSEGQQYNIPGVGAIPGWLAKAYGPAYLRANATEQAAQTRGQYGVQEANIGAQGRIAAQGVAQRFKAVPGVGLFDTQSRQVIPGTQQGVTVTQELADDYGLPADFIGKPMKISDLNGLNRNENQQITTVQGAGGPALVNKRTKQTTPLGLGAPAMGGIVPVAADPNNPGNITYAPKTQAVQGNLASPQSAPTAAAKSTLKSATSGKIGDEINAFNTANQHANLLESTLTALNNGDVKAINSLKNRFKTEFGSADVTNFQTIANAYTREVTKMLASGHMTDAEIRDQGATLPSNASPQQLLGALRAYRALATSKMQMRQQQVQQGMTGRPNFPTNEPQAGAATHRYNQSTGKIEPISTQ